MADKTTLVMPGKRLTVPKALKRSVQILLAVALTSFLVLVVMSINGMLVGRGTTMQGFNAWLAFIRRPDIFAMMALTAVVTVLLVYWQRDSERR
jgi:ABC-type sulfate transport system permease subunit